MRLAALQECGARTFPDLQHSSAVWRIVVERKPYLGGYFLLSFLNRMIQKLRMPIRPEHRWLYPIDWPEISRIVRFERAGGRCEHCKRPHGRRVAQLIGADGTWWDADARHWRDGRGRVVRRPPAFIALDAIRMTRKPVYLATAHLNHDPRVSGRRWRNLAALCPRCHMMHDAPEHRRRRWWNAFRRRALGDLFTGRYT